MDMDVLFLVIGIILFLVNFMILCIANNVFSVAMAFIGMAASMYLIVKNIIELSA